MMQAKTFKPSRYMKDVTFPNPKGLDSYHTDASIPEKYCREMLNVRSDILNLKASSGYALAGNAPIFTQAGQTVNDCYGQVTVGGVRYAIFREYRGVTNSYYMRWLNLSTGTRGRVKKVDGVTDETYFVPLRVTAFRSKAIIHGSTFTAIAEFDGTVWTSRAMGVPVGPIVDIENRAGSPGPIGDYVYAVELVHKEGDIVIRSSGMNRRTTTGVPYGQVTNASNNAKRVWVYDDSQIFTHARLWRTQRLDVNTATGIILGNLSTMYCVAELDYDTCMARVETHLTLDAWYFTTDIVTDTQIPVGIDGRITTDDVLDLDPVDGFKEIGVVSGYKLFMASPTDDPEGIYLSAAQYSPIYEEQVNWADRVGVAGGGTIQKLHGFGEDLVIACYSSHYRLPNADIDSPLIAIGENIGASSWSCSWATDEFGILLVREKGELWRCGVDYVWREEVEDKVLAECSQGMLGPFSFAAGARFSVAICRYTLNIGLLGSNYYFTLHPRTGWIKRSYARIGTETQYKTMFLLDTGFEEPDVVVYATANEGQVSHMVGPKSTTETPSDARIIYGPVQASTKGNGIVENLELRIEGVFYGAPATVTLLTGTDTESDDGHIERLMEPVEQGTFLSAKCRTHRFRIADQGELENRVASQRLFYKIEIPGSGSDLWRIDSVTARVIVDEDYVGMDTEGTDVADSLRISGELTSDLLLRYTRPNPLTDLYGNGDLEHLAT